MFKIIKKYPLYADFAREHTQCISFNRNKISNSQKNKNYVSFLTWLWGKNKTLTGKSETPCFLAHKLDISNFLDLEVKIRHRSAKIRQFLFFNW